VFEDSLSKACCIQEIGYINRGSSCMTPSRSPNFVCYSSDLEMSCDFDVISSLSKDFFLALHECSLKKKSNILVFTLS